MKQYANLFKPCAIGLCAVYLIVIFLCPFFIAKESSISFYGDSETLTEGASFSDVMKETAWPILAIVAGVAMIVAILVLPGKPAAGACLAGSFLALVAFWLARGHFDDLLNLANTWGSLGGMKVSLNLGTGPILAMVCGVIAAILCWLSDQGPRREVTPGLDKYDSGNEW